MTYTRTGTRIVPVIALVSLLFLSWLHSLDPSIQSLRTDTLLKDPMTQHQSPELSFSNILFVDVRKSGGKEIKRNFEVVCENSWEECTPDSTLSDKVKGYLHTKECRPKGAIEAAEAYLYNLRHPIDRIMSWYQFERPDACMNTEETRKACSTAHEIELHPQGETALFFETCFPSKHLLPLAFNDAGDLSHECTELARQVVEGRMDGPGFRQTPFQFDMRYYASKTIDRYPDKNVLVIRSEYVWDDLNDLDLKLGGTGSFHAREGNEEYHTSKDAADYRSLCCMLQEEMRTYRRLLELAVNIDGKSKETTIMSAAKRCGFSSWDKMVAQCQQQIAGISSTVLSFNSILFVDIRKSGGTMVKENFKSYCEMQPENCSKVSPNSKLSDHITAYFHGKGLPPTQAIEAVDTYLFNLRHPVDRVIASYHLDKPSDCTQEKKHSRTSCSMNEEIAAHPQGEVALFFKECFQPSLTSIDILNHECIRLARKVIEGRVDGLKTFKPLSYYTNLTIDQFRSKSVLVARSESIWEDLNNLELSLGGYDGAFGVTEESLDSRGKINHSADYASLCCALIDEIQIYRYLLEHAVNLAKEAKEETMAEAVNKCGFSSWNAMIDQCQHPSSLTQQIAPSESPSQPVLPFEDILFVHVGKAGGQTLRVLFKAFCESDRTRIPKECADAPNSMLSDKTKGYLHPKEIRPPGAIELAEAYLFNLRHPVDRMISWYHYEHPQSCLKTLETRLACNAANEVKKNAEGEAARFFQKCFPTIHFLPLAFNHTDSSALTRECVDLGQQVLEGRISGRGFKHISYNMHYYTNLTIDQFPSKKILVVRTESLWDDLKDLDVQLGGNGTFGDMEGTKDTHGSEKYRKSNDTLSVADYGLLCCGLRDEMNIYRHLLELAVNLNAASKEATITNTAKRCGFSSWNEMADECTRQRI